MKSSRLTISSSLFALALAPALLHAINASEGKALSRMPMPQNGDYTLTFDSPISRAIPANLDGDGLTDWIVKYRQVLDGVDTLKMEARDHAGKFLWKFDTLLAKPRNSETKDTPALPWDLDGDGRDEVITMRYDLTPDPNIKGTIVTLDGKTGEVIDTTPVPWAGGSGNSLFTQGTTRTHFTIAYLDGYDRPPSFCAYLAPYVDGVCWAFDFVNGKIKRRWSYQHCSPLGTGSHGLAAFDINGDGRDEILMGGTVLDADGCKIFSWTDYKGYGHTDRISAGDIDPTRPGVELVFAFELGRGVAMTSAEGKIQWHDATYYHDHTSWVANVSDEYPGDEIFTAPKLLTDAEERAAARYYNAQGDRIALDYPYEFNRPLEWTGDEIYESWHSVVERMNAATGKSYQRIGAAGSPYWACDLGGGDDHGAEEIILVDGRTLHVLFNQQARPHPSRRDNLNYRRMAVSSFGSGSPNTDYKTVWNPPLARKYGPTAYATIAGQRDIGVRRQSQATNGERLFQGSRFVLFRGAAYTFHGDSSWDSNGDKIDSYHWNFGDGTVADDANPTKHFDKNGSFTVTLTIKAGGEVAREEIGMQVQDVVVDYVSHIPHHLVVRGFADGTKLYTDRDAVAEKVPAALRGMTLIQTNAQYEADRSSRLSAWISTKIPTESITFRASEDCFVYVAMDESFKEVEAKDSALQPGAVADLKPHAAGDTTSIKLWPEWLDEHEGWERTDLQVENSLNGRAHQLYRRAYWKGDVVRLGPNRYKFPEEGDAGRNMYFVLISNRANLAEFYQQIYRSQLHGRIR